MKLDAFLLQLESFRIRCEENKEDFDSTLKLELIDLLLDYIDNPKVRAKIDEIPF